MIRILLACSAGMSTSMLVTKMQNAAKAANIDAKVWAVPDSEVRQNIGEFDILLLAPHIRFKEKRFKELADNKFPIAIVDMGQYGTMNGEVVLNFAIDQYHRFYDNKQ